MASELRSSFLLRQDEQTRRVIFELADQVAERLDAWGRDFPVIRSVRFKPLAIQLAASAPFCSVDALVTAGCGTLWIFAIDDAFDEELVPFDDMLVRSDVYRRMVFGDDAEVDRSDPLAMVLHDVIRDLSKYELFEGLRGYWGSSVMGTVEGMIKECRWRERYKASMGTEVPTYEEYILNGRYSIGGPPHFMTSIISIGDESSVAVIPELHERGLMASACIRLANDLRTYEKELAEGNVNSVVLMQVLHGVDGAEARRMVKGNIESGLRECRVRNTVCTRSGVSERLILDTAEFACEFYGAHDFHHEISG